MLADLGLLYCALFWGISFASMKILVGVYPACWLLFLRFGAGAVMIYMFFHKRINKNFKSVFFQGVIIGVLLFAAIATQTVGLNYIGGGRSAFISGTYVILVPLILWAAAKIFPGWAVMLAAVLCVCGMYLLTDDVSGSFSVGDVLTMICAFTFAIQVIALGKFAHESDPIVLSFVEFITLAVCSFAGSFLFETRKILLDAGTMPELLFTIILCTFGCYVIQICAQKYAEPSHATIIMSLESVFGLISSVIFLGEVVNARTLTGCALIFCAVLLSEFAPYLKKL